MKLIHATVTKVVFDHDGELSDEEVVELSSKVKQHTFTFHPDEFQDGASVCDAVSDYTGWCVSYVDYNVD